MKQPVAKVVRLEVAKRLPELLAAVTSAYTPAAPLELEELLRRVAELEALIAAHGQAGEQGEADYYGEVLASARLELDATVLQGRLLRQWDDFEKRRKAHAELLGVAAKVGLAAAGAALGAA